MNLWLRTRSKLKHILPAPAKSIADQISVLENELHRSQNEILRLSEMNKRLISITEELMKRAKEGSWGDYRFGRQEAIYAYSSSVPTSRYPEELCKWYYQKTGKVLNLYSPKTFSEKIQWLKLYDATPLKTMLADKYLVRNWLQERIGDEYLVPLLGVWDSFEEIDFSILPERFALKANHGSNMNCIVKDKASFDIAAAQKQFSKWMMRNFAFMQGYELQYMNIPPKIIAEQYIENTEGLKDYRFLCFNGIPAYVWVDIFSGTPDHKRTIYDMEWQPVPMRCTWPDGGDLLKEKPKTFEKMKELARLLSKDFSFVRIDFFDVDGKLYMGEMTFTPMSGLGVFDPPEWDLRLGNMIFLPPKGPIPERIR